MSQNITLGLSRKTGKWEIIVGPEEPYDAHLRAYQKITVSHPVCDEYSKVLLGRIQNTSTPQTLITAEENKKRLAMAAKFGEAMANSAKSAADRQKAIDDEMAKKVADRHAEELAIKNKSIEEIRKATGQPPAVPPTKTEPPK